MKYRIVVLILIMFSFLIAEFEQILIREEQEKIGLEIFSRMKKEIGGVDQIQNIFSKGTVSQPVSCGILTSQIEVTAQFPDKLNIKLDDKEYSINKNKGWIKYEEGYFESMSENDQIRFRGNLKRNVVYILKYYDQLEILFQQYEFIDDSEYAIFQINNNEQNMKLYVDIKTYLPYKMLYNSSSQTDNIELEKRFLEFKEVDKVKFPVHTKTYDQQGILISENFIEELKLNIKISSDQF